MAHVVEYEEFKAVERRLVEAERHIAFMTGLLLSQQWLNRAQTMKALNVSRMTLHRLTKDGKLTYRYEGTRPFYCVTGLRNYLNGQKIDVVAADQRLMTACQQA